jgi:hypothetical protein
LRLPYAPAWEQKLHRNIKGGFVMISAEKSVYISYSWKKERRKKTVEKIMAAFSAVGVAIKRDEKEIGYGDPIRAYMDELAAGGAIILVLSELYIKSPNCMYELLEIYNHDRKKFRERIVPVVLKGTKFHKAIDRLPYIRFWEEETKRLKAELGSVDMTNIGTVSHQELRKYVEVSNKIDDLLSLIGDMNHLKEEDHLKDNFSSLIKRIFPILPPSGGGGEQQTNRKMESNIHQKVVGNGNIISGSGDVHVTHFHHIEMPPSSGAASSESKNHSFSRSSNLKRDINDLQQQWDLLSDKLNRLQKQHILETRVEETFRLEHLIKEAQAARDVIDRKLDMLHNQQ